MITRPLKAIVRQITSVTAIPGSAASPIRAPPSVNATSMSQSRSMSCLCVIDLFAHSAQQVKQRKNNQPDQVGGVPVGGEGLHALVVLRAVGARLGARDHPQQSHHSPQDMYNVGKGQV